MSQRIYKQLNCERKGDKQNYARKDIVEENDGEYI